jgi:hypothetical protein
MVRMKLKIAAIFLGLLFVSDFCIGQDFPISRFYTYGNTPFEIICQGIPEFESGKSEIKYQRVFEIEGQKNKLHGIALKYIGDFYKSAKSVIDVNDSENGLIIVKGTFVNSYSRYYRKTQMMNMSLETDHSLMFEIKDNRIRITIDNLKIRVNGSSISDFEEFIKAYESKDGLNGNEEDFRFKANMGIPINLIHNDVTSFMDGIKNYFEKASKDDW